jgi:hypothetical protein
MHNNRWWQNGIEAIYMFARYTLFRIEMKEILPGVYP